MEDSFLILKKIYCNQHSMNDLWCQRDIYSNTLLECINILNSNNNSQKKYADYFIHATISSLIKKPSDIIYATSNFNGDQVKLKFLELLLSNPLVNYFVVKHLPFDEQCIHHLMSHKDWIDLALRVRLTYLIDESNDRNLSHFDLFGTNTPASQFTRQYLLSWAFESDRLSDDGVNFFQKEFPKKFATLKAIKEKLQNS